MSKIPATRKHFCLAPWVHMHIWPDGNVFPCCVADIEKPLGNTNRQTLLEVWNSAKMRKLRLAMLNDSKSSICNRCYEMEEAGTSSHRIGIIDKHFRHHEPIVETTQKDGSVKELNLPYMDIRFSNLCNFRCRTCGPALSSGWIKEYVQLDLMKRKQYRVHPNPKVLHVTKGPLDLWEQLEQVIPTLEEIYFAGGEPFLSEEHFRLLEVLVEKQLFNVRLRYSTNFSKPVYNGVDAFKLWDRFENVSVGASLDGMGKRGEYLRKGQRWEETVQNRIRMKEVCPRVKFFIPATLSLMNSLHLPDFHRDWVERGLLDINDFYINFLQDPTYYRIQVLPEVYKEKVRQKYRAHIEWIKAKDPNLDGLVKQFESAVQFMDMEDRSLELNNFLSMTKKVDFLRKEDFTRTFPEFKDIFKIRIKRPRLKQEQKPEPRSRQKLKPQQKPKQKLNPAKILKSNRRATAEEQEAIWRWIAEIRRKEVLRRKKKKKRVKS